MTDPARSTLRRIPDRGSRDPALIADILDRSLLCHVGLQIDGQPFVIPMTYARRDDHLILHGSTASRTMRHLGSGAEACVEVTLLDALVLARSGFHHSMNYRSVVAFGRGSEISGEAEKREALDHLVDALVPGRSKEARGPSPQELKATAVVRFPLSDATAKRRSGPPSDDAEDLALPVWAGTIPLELRAGAPQDAPDLRDGVARDASVEAWARRPLA